MQFCQNHDAEPFEEFRYSGCVDLVHKVCNQLSCVCHYLELQLCIVSLAVSIISLETAVGYTQIWLRTSRVEFLDPGSTILPGLRTVLNDDEAGLCLWPPGD